MPSVDARDHNVYADGLMSWLLLTPGAAAFETDTPVGAARVYTLSAHISMHFLYSASAADARGHFNLALHTSSKFNSACPPASATSLKYDTASPRRALFDAASLSSH